MKRKILGGVLACIALFTTSVASAANITYFLNDPLNIDIGYGTGSVTGTITTDGTIGLLGPGNIDTFDLTAHFGIYTTHLIGNFNAGRVVGSSVTATPTQLLLDFSGSQYFAFSSGPGTDFYIGWTPGSYYGYYGGTLVAEAGYDVVGTNWLIHAAAGGPYDYQSAAVIAAVPGPTAVAPVPSPVAGAGLPGLIAACGGLGLWRRRRQKTA